MKYTKAEEKLLDQYAIALAGKLAHRGYDQSHCEEWAESCYILAAWLLRARKHAHLRQELAPDAVQHMRRAIRKAKA